MDFGESRNPEPDIKPNKALLDRMINAEKESKEQVKPAWTKSREAEDKNLVKIEDKSAPPTESRTTALASTLLAKNAKGLFFKKKILQVQLSLTRLMESRIELSCTI